MLGQIFGDIADVLVLGAARQDLVADHEEAGSYRHGALAHGVLRGDLRLARRRRPLKVPQLATPPKF